MASVAGPLARRRLRFPLSGPQGRRLFLPALGLVLAFLAWVWGYRYTEYLPAPTAVWTEARELLSLPDTYFNVWVSLRRLTIGLGLGYLAAFFVTMAMRLSKWWEAFFSLYVFVTLTVPSLAMALFSLMIFGLSERGVYFAVGVVVFPFVVIGLNNGFKTLDSSLTDMAKVYRLSWPQRVRHVAIPEMAPHMFAAFRNAHALAWKLVVVTEVFSQQTGIGYKYKKAFDYFELNELMVWLFFFLAVVFSVEYGVLRPMERRTSRWRRV
jgi:NitT/TauT family transport system permease protein